MRAEPGVRAKGKGPKARRIIRWASAGLIAALLTAYFGIRLLSGLVIDAPAETAQGLQQRAAAAQKVIRYDGWMSAHPFPGGWLKAILLWPIQPTQAEIDAATEFAALVMGGYQELQASRFICGSLPAWQGDDLPQEAVALVGEVATSVRSADAATSGDLASMILRPITARFPCTK
jgi:hypothetical protein